VHNELLHVGHTTLLQCVGTGSFFPQVDTCGQTTNRRL